MTNQKPAAFVKQYFKLFPFLSSLYFKGYKGSNGQNCFLVLPSSVYGNMPESIIVRTGSEPNAFHVGYGDHEQSAFCTTEMLLQGEGSGWLMHRGKRQQWLLDN